MEGDDVAKILCRDFAGVWVLWISAIKNICIGMFTR